MGSWLGLITGWVGSNLWESIFGCCGILRQRLMRICVHIFQLAVPFLFIEFSRGGGA
jgi:hypothetical protein